MVASLIFLIATRVIVSSADRLKLQPGFGPFGVVPTMPAYMTHRLSPNIQIPVNLLHAQMQIAADSDDNLPELFLQELRRLDVSVPAATGMNANRMSVLTAEGRTWIRDVLIPQTFPPAQVYDIDTRQLLQNFADSFDASFEERVNHHTYAREKAIVLHIMLDLIAEATGIFKVNRAEWVQQWARRHGMKEFDLKGKKWFELDEKSCVQEQARILMQEMVGLMPKGFEFQSGSSALDASVLAVGVFSRASLFDDSMGSIRTKIEESVPGKLIEYYQDPVLRQLNVFEIEGIADTPGLTEGSARILLSKLDQYAHEEDKKIVVVAKRAYTSSDGTDLTEYYEQLGFERVVMEHGLDELVYTGKAYSAMSSSEVESQQIMINMNLWGL